jgi:hypothetical protein
MNQGRGVLEARNNLLVHGLYRVVTQILLLLVILIPATPSPRSYLTEVLAGTCSQAETRHISLLLKPYIEQLSKHASDNQLVLKHLPFTLL